MNNMLILGKTGIKTNKNGFGALPIQRISENDAITLINKAYSNNITFFDTARAYTNSEERLGKALRDVRENIYIATKTMATNPEDFWKDLDTSLNNLQTDYIDLYQFHNPSFCPKPNDGSMLYEAMLQAKEENKIKHIGITFHNFKLAEESIRSGLYETLQFPFSYLSDEKELTLVKLCKEYDVGFIAMKAMAGGLLSDGKVAYTYMDQFDNVLPIWGVQKENELDEFLFSMENSLSMDSVQETIDKDKEELTGEFCRGCGYCMPCPQDIKIGLCARMSLWLRRMPPEDYLKGEFPDEIEKINSCTNCGKCISSCPYDLNIPRLLKDNYVDYQNILSGKTKLN